MSHPLTDIWQDIGDSAGSDVVALFDRLRAAGATDEELERALSMRITAQNLHGGALGEGLGRDLLTQWGDADQIKPLSLATVAHELDRPRLARAVSTVLARIDASAPEESLAMVVNGLHRLARSEVLEAGQGSFRNTVVSSETVAGWIREPESDACQLCEWWARDGRTWPKDHTMPTHKGCTCAQRFVRIERHKLRGVSQRGYDASQERASAGTLDERRQMAEGQYSERSTRGATDGDEAGT